MGSYGGTNIKNTIPYSSQSLASKIENKLYNSNDVIAILWNKGVLNSSSIINNGTRDIKPLFDESGGGGDNDMSQLNVYKCI
jgi:hypothetical protein